MKQMRHILAIIFFLYTSTVSAQDTTDYRPLDTIFDTIAPDAKPIKDTLTAEDTMRYNLHDPRKSTIRSAIIPGWGQAYNKEYWKIPIVYGAIAVPTSTFIYNHTWYKRTRDAYNILVNQDSALLPTIHPKLQGLSAESMQFYRNAFRKDRDFSVLWFFIIWGLNVVDATVFGHLKDFNVSDDLSFHIKPDYDPTFKTAQLGFVFKLQQGK